MAVSLRFATVDDAALLHSVAAATFALACPPDTTQASIDAFIAEHLSEASFAGYLADPQRQLIIGQHNGAAAGYTMLVYGEPTDADVAAAVALRPTAELSKCYVMADHHGTGLAGTMIAASVGAARERGALSVWLGVNIHNARANRFYEKNGFAQVGTKRFLVGDRYEDDFVRELVF